MKAACKLTLSVLLIASTSAHAGLPEINLRAGGEIKAGVYGQVRIGTLPIPPLLFPDPLMIHHPSSGVVPPPLYLHVPPGHAKKWPKHCHEYNACGLPVYFVRSAEYEVGYKSHEQGHNNGKKYNGLEGEMRGNKWGKSNSRGEKSGKGRGHE